MNEPTEAELRAARERWTWRGGQRPPFAHTPGPGQESVWDYPRPPALRPDSRRVQICLGDLRIADTTGAWRLLETAGAPTFYLPPADVHLAALIASPASSVCEWKGRARYWDVTDGRQTRERAAWAYADADGPYAAIAGYLAFYARSLQCFVDGERVRAQPGGFYGGWVTDDVVGPFKGEPCTLDW